MTDPSRMLESVHRHARIRSDCARHPLELVDEWELECSRLWRIRSPWFDDPIVIAGEQLKSAERMRTAALNQEGVILPPAFDKLWPELLELLLGKLIYLD